MKKNTIKHLNKYLLAIALGTVFGAYAAYSRMHEGADNIPGDAAGTLQGDPGDAPEGTGPIVSGAAQIYKDGTYNGKMTDAFYGYYQVAAVISDGKLSDIKFLIYPNDRHESTEINEQAIPILKSEAIRSQSADVDIVSGATQSAEAFRESLASALEQARS